MALKYRDFAPPAEELGLMGRPGYASFEKAVESANGWIDALHVDVVSVETVLLPGGPHSTGTDEGELRADGDQGSWYQIVRVWYREDTSFQDSVTGEIRVFKTTPPK